MDDHEGDYFDGWLSGGGERSEDDQGSPPLKCYYESGIGELLLREEVSWGKNLELDGLRKVIVIQNFSIGEPKIEGTRKVIKLLLNEDGVLLNDQDDILDEIL